MKFFRTMLRLLNRVLHPLLMLAARLHFFTVHLVFEFIHLFTSRIYVTKPTDGLLMISATQAVQKIINREVGLTGIPRLFFCSLRFMLTFPDFFTRTRRSIYSSNRTGVSLVVYHLFIFVSLSFIFYFCL